MVWSLTAVASTLVGIIWALGTLTSLNLDATGLLVAGIGFLFWIFPSWFFKTLLSQRNKKHSGPERFPPVLEVALHQSWYLAIYATTFFTALLVVTTAGLLIRLAGLDLKQLSNPATSIGVFLILCLGLTVGVVQYLTRLQWPTLTT